MCVCGLSYPARIAHSPYYTVCVAYPALQYFSKLSHKRYDLREKIIEHKITLFDLQPDAQNSYLFTCNTFIKILYMFQALPCSSSGGLRRNCIYEASGIVTLCRCGSWYMFDLQLDAQNSYLFTSNTFIKILYVFRVLPCSSSGGLRRPPEDEHSNARNM